MCKSLLDTVLAQMILLSCRKNSSQVKSVLCDFVGSCSRIKHTDYTRIMSTRSSDSSDPEWDTFRVDKSTSNDDAAGPLSKEEYDEVSSSSSSAAVEFAKVIGRLKTTPRTGWVRRGVPHYESVADHSWGVAALSLLLGSHADSNSHPKIDIAKCMQIAVVHDLAECLVGDIAPGDGISKIDKQRMEEEAISQIAATLRQASGHNKLGDPSASESLLMNLFHEYEERTSDEAVAVKDLDLLDMILQANEYEERFGTDLTEFFEGTPVFRFQNAKLRRIAAEVHKQREERVQRDRRDTVSLDDGARRISKSDSVFVADYAKSFSLEVDAVRDIVLALRQWERPNEEIR